MSDGKYSIKNLVDIESLHKTLEKLSLITGIAIGLIDYPSKEILFGTGWTDICSKFHRAFPESAQYCKQSNFRLTQPSKTPQEFNVMSCEHGLMDGATPIIIKDNLIAYLAIGQVFLQPPNMERFKNQAKRYGYDWDAYSEALSRVPIVSKDRFDHLLSFLSELAVTVSKAGLYNLELKEKTSTLEEEIADRKRVEAELKESEERYRSLFTNNHSVMLLIDPESADIIDANPAASSFYGWTRQELVNKKITDINTLPVDQIFEQIRLARTRQRRNFQFRHRLASGQIRDVDVYSGSIKVHGRELLCSIVHDITSRKRAEEALRESEEKYRFVLEANPDPIVVYDMQGRVTYFNPAFRQVFGWTLEERLGRKMDLFVPEENWSETKTMIDKVKAGESFSGVESKRYDKAGKIIDVSISGAIYRDRTGRPAGSIINLRNISEQKHLESQLSHSQKMEAIGTLAGGIAHDFNNLLMGIQGRTSLIMSDHDTSHPNFEHLKGIETYVKSAADLTAQLLAFARGGKYEVKPTELNKLILNSAEMFGRTKKEIVIHKKLQQDLWVVEIDRSQIEQVLLNMYVNAWQSMPAGGELYLETANVILDQNYVKPYFIEPGKYIKISITDTGIGMDKATQERIFDPFFTTKEMGRGTGLGLASSYGIIKNHGGYIDVYSEKGKGSTFIICLPASEKKVVTDSKFTNDVSKGTETILLVDDEEMIVEVGKELLKKIGYKVLIARSGETALQLYESNKDEIDMVILDMIMPEMGGGDTYDRLKAINPDIKVLLSSGYSINGQAAEILERGCNGFIQKPFNLANLSIKIRQILDEG